MKASIRKYLYWLLLAAVAAVAFACSLGLEWYGDALHYRFSFADGKPISSIGDIITSQIAHYSTMNGRVWVHVLCQFFIGITGKTVFALCNAAVYALFVIVFARYALGNKTDLTQKLWAALLVLFICDTNYTPNCQIGYVWTSALSILFLYTLRQEKESPLPVAHFIASVAIAFFAGSGNEALSLGIAGALCIELVMNWRRYTLRDKILIVTYGLGAAVLIFAPSNFRRQAGAYNPPLSFTLYTMAISLRAFYLMIVILAISLIKKRVGIKRFYTDNRLLINAIAIMLIFNIVIGVKMNRQLFCIELFSAVLALRLLDLYRIPLMLTGVFAAVVGAIYIFKAVVITEFNSDVRTLRHELTAHPHSDIYIDLTLQTSLVNPAETFGYKDNVNLLYHVAAIIDDINDRGNFYVRSSDWSKAYEGVRLYPTAMREALQGEVKNQWHESDGVYLLLRDKKHPARFMLDREISIFSLGIPMSPYEVQFDNAYGLDTDDYNVLVTSFPVPMMHPLDITISEQ